MSYKNEILDRVKQRYNLSSNTSLAIFLEVTPQAVSNWYSRNTLDFDKLIAKCHPEDIAWIIYGDEAMPPQESKCVYGRQEDTTIGFAADVTAQYKPTMRNTAGQGLHSVPLYELSAKHTLSDLFANPKHHKPTCYLSLPGLSSCDGALYVRGDSMHPLLHSGDIILYKQVTDFACGILWGELYLLAFELGGQEYVTVRRIQQGHDGSTVCLTSSNPAYPMQEIALEAIRSLARINVSIRYNTMG